MNHIMARNWIEVSFANHREAPDLPGIYCWRYRPKIGLGQINKLRAQLSAESDPLIRGRILHDSIQGQLLMPFNRPAYSLSLRGSLLPDYDGIATHRLPDVSNRFVSLANDLDQLDSFMSILGELYDMLSMPFYIGIASEMTLRTRIQSHVSAISRYKNQGRFEDISDNESKTLAARIVERRINPVHLWISCLPFPDPSCTPNLSDLEFVLNRSINPVLGRN
jgi:hypothetical protein